MIIKKYKNGRLVSTSSPKTPDPIKKKRGLPTIFKTLKNKTRTRTKTCSRRTQKVTPIKIRRKSGCGCGR